MDNTVTKLFTKKEIAEYCGVDPRTIDNWRREKGFPSIPITTHSLRFDLADVRAWLSEQKREG